MNTVLANILALTFTGQDVLSVLIVFIVLFAFLATWAINRISILRIRKRTNQTKEMSAIMQHTLDISNNYVQKLDIQNHHGVNLHGDLLPEEGISFEDSFECIHPDDRLIYREFIMRLYHGETTNDECTFRWDMSNVQHLGDWHYMHDNGVAEFGNGKENPPTTIFCTLSDVTEQMRKEQEEAQLMEKYRMMFEQSIVGLAFYDKDGNLLTANQKMREILKFQSEDDPYYYSHSLFEMPTFRNLLSGRYVEELFFCTKSVIIERGVNCYTEIRVHPINNNKGELYYITLSIRDVTQERELYLQNKRNDIEMRQVNEAIQQYEMELQYLMETCDMHFFRTSFADRTVTFYRGLEKAETQVTFEQQQAILVKSAFKEALDNPEELLSKPMSDLSLCRSYLSGHEADTLVWNMIDSVPYDDGKGQIIGSYGILRNVTPLIEKQEQLKRETERANDSGRLKSVFMANMSHEIRTPLNSIVGFSDVLSMLSTPEEKQEIVRVIMNNCDMLLRLINDILAISSLDTGGIHIEPCKVDFAKSFNDICDSLKERVQQPGVEFIKENPYETLEIHIDNGRMQQVITNFVTNAVKYTHQGYIKVGYRQETRQVDGETKDGLYIYCEDTGDGIPEEAQGKIFDRFVKLNDYIQGTGLGLSICKAIADACKGKVGVVSEGNGKGSTFWLWIPLKEMKSETEA